MPNLCLYFSFISVIPESIGDDVNDDNEDDQNENWPLAVPQRRPNASLSKKNKKSSATANHSSQRPKRSSIDKDCMKVLEELFKTYMTQPCGKLPSTEELDKVRKNYPMLAQYSTKKLKDAVRNRRVSLAKNK